LPLRYLLLRTVGVTDKFLSHLVSESLSQLPLTMEPYKRGWKHTVDRLFVISNLLIQT